MNVGCVHVMFLFKAIYRIEADPNQAGKKPAGDDDEDLDDEDDLEEDESKAKTIKTSFELADTLYAEAELENTDTVYLWLGVSCISLSSLISVFFYLIPSHIHFRERATNIHRCSVVHSSSLPSHLVISFISLITWLFSLCPLPAPN
jgi:hypothetical protein